MSEIYAPKSWGSVTGAVAEWLRKLAESIDLMADGQSRTVGSVTLTASATTTTVTDRRVTGSSHIALSPTTANAAAALSGTYISARTSGSGFTLTHASNSQTDRTFTYEIRSP